MFNVLMQITRQSITRQQLGVFVGAELAKGEEIGTLCDLEGDLAEYALMMSDLRIGRQRTQVRGSDHKVT